MTIERGYMLPSGEWRIYTDGAWIGGIMPRDPSQTFTFDEVRAHLVAGGYAVPDASGWELRGDTDADGWVITGPATAPTA